MIIEEIEINEIDEPFKDSGGDQKDLTNPYSKSACLILFLYSIEPPFYAYLNRAIRSHDSKEVKNLGPFASALY